MTETELKAEIDKIVVSHCNEFWLKNKLGVDYYVSQAREKMAWTGGGAGLNQKLKDSISEEKRSVMYNDILPGVFYQIARRINMENENKLRESYKELSNYLNQTITFNMIDNEKKYANHLVKIGPLNDKAIVENWTGKLSKDGSLATRFTLYGHMYVGLPNQLQIFEADANIDKDEPIRLVEFKVTPPTIKIDLSEEAPSVDEINGLWSSSSIVITDFDLGPPPEAKEADSEDGEIGCDIGQLEIYNLISAILEEKKGLPWPFRMELKLNPEGIGIMYFTNLDNEEDEIYEDDEPTTLDVKYKNGDIEAVSYEDGGVMKLIGKIKKLDEKIILSGKFNFSQDEKEMVSGNWNGVK